MSKQKQPFETTLQDLVYSMDAGTGLKMVRTALFCLLVLLGMVVLTAREFRGFDNEAAMDNAQLARNLAQSGRYITDHVRPVTIAEVSARTFNGDALIERHPELFRPPLYPALLAGVFRVFDLTGLNLFPTSREFEGMRIYPAEQWVIIPMNHLFTALTGLFLYLLGNRLFSRKIALLGTVVFFLTESVWRESLRGAGTPVLLFFSLGAVYFSLRCMMNRRERRPVWNWGAFFLLSALFSAAAFLTHYAALAIIPGIALFILLMGTRGRRSAHLVVFYLAIIVLLVSPWLLRNYRYVRSPLGLAPHTALIGSAGFPEDTFMRTLTPRFSPGRMFNLARAKWTTNFSSLYEDHFAALGGGLLMCFFLAAFFYRFVRVHVHMLRWGIALSLILFFTGAGFFDREVFRYYHLFRPFVILYGLAFLSILLDRLDLGIQLYRSALTGLVIGLSALPLLVTLLFSPAAKQTYPPYYVPFVMRVSELLRPNEVICTDMPWATAWYGKRLSILLPQTLDDFYEINDYRKYISGLYITTLTKDRPFVSSLLDGREKSWFPVTMGRLPEGFPLRHGFSMNKQDQLFLTDSVRWAPGETRPAEDAEPEPQPEP